MIMVVIDKNNDLYYIVAGDAMQKLMCSKFPDRHTIPFREDFSKGKHIGFSFDAESVSQRALIWNVSEIEYIEKLSPIISLDITKRYVLCFGEDDCCKANLAFMLGYLKSKGYCQSIKVQILDEYNLNLQKEYFVD